MISTFRIVQAVSKEELVMVKQLLSQYAELREYDAALGAFEHELTTLPGKYGPPNGCLLLAYSPSGPMGCVALQRLSADVCEMKRLFVPVEFEGNGIGQTLARKICKEAEKIGYKKIVLDTHPWMTRAKDIYALLGFKEIERYNDNPTKGIKFYELKLNPPKAS